MLKIHRETGAVGHNSLERGKYHVHALRNCRECGLDYVRYRVDLGCDGYRAHGRDLKDYRVSGRDWTDYRVNGHDWTNYRVNDDYAASQ